MSRPYGDCFKASLESAGELQIMKDAVEQSKPEGEQYQKIYESLGLSESIYIVHGTAIPSDGLGQRPNDNSCLDRGGAACDRDIKQPVDENHNRQLLRPPRHHPPNTLLRK